MGIIKQAAPIAKNPKLLGKIQLKRQPLLLIKIKTNLHQLNLVLNPVKQANLQITVKTHKG